MFNPITLIVLSVVLAALICLVIGVIEYVRSGAHETPFE